MSKQLQKLDEHIKKQNEKLEEQVEKNLSLEKKLLRIQASEKKNPSTSNLDEVLFVTSAKKCEFPDDKHGGKRSQSGEDKILLTWFGNLCGGTYIELGALDGVKFSNSYVFNMLLQWKGVMIELIKGNYDELVVNRPNEIATIHAGVCDKPQKLHYFTDAKPAVSGIYEFATPSFRERWWGKNVSLDDPRVQEIDCDTLDGLLLKNAKNVKFFDFLSLDVEGAELAVLKSIDFDRVGFGIIFAETSDNMQKNLAVRSLMESKGYFFIDDNARSYWFANLKFYEIYKDLIC